MSAGPVLAPHDCWLLLPGLKTLAVRLDRQQENAACLANLFTRCWRPLPMCPRRHADGWGLITGCCGFPSVLSIAGLREGLERLSAVKTTCAQ